MKELFILNFCNTVLHDFGMCAKLIVYYRRLRVLKALMYLEECARNPHRNPKAFLTHLPGQIFLYPNRPSSVSSVSLGYRYHNHKIV